MIFKGPNGVSPSVNIFIGGVLVDYANISSFDLVLEENKHDYLELVITGLPPAAVNDYWGAPVRMHMESASRYSFTFAGYVDVVKPQSDSSSGLVNGSSLQTASLVCLGASYGMRGTRSKDWSGYSLDQIVTEMGVRHGFSSEALKAKAIHSTLIQANESDWQFLTRVSKLMGRSVNVHGTRLHSYDPFAARNRLPSFHVLPAHGFLGGGTLEGQIFTFNANFTTKMKEQSSVTMSNGEVLTLGARTGSPYSKTFATSTGTQHSTVQQGLAAITASQRSSYDDEAKLVVSGIAGCVPGGVVQIVGMADGVDGLWYVSTVKHRVNGPKYISELTVKRNKPNQLKRSNVPIFAPGSASVLRKGSWVASPRTSNVYT